MSLGNLEFRADSEWLIGLDASLLRAIDLAVIFNDPEIYGLRIGLHGGAVKVFDGLEFEILYQRITDTLGKYHVELVLPKDLRHIQLGAVSITLGVIVVDVYTNGDFKLDFGFPWQGDFARSSALEVFPFVGAGGFYLNKLSALTAGDSSVPTPKNPKASFTPIYEFGLGLRIGVGKSFRSGPLSASISIIVEGIVEGVISWYNPPALPAGDGKSAVLPAPELYYRIRGGVAIVGRLHGRVDFKVIAVVVDVVARAGILFAIEPYRPIAIALVARVDVQAFIEIAFITVDFSFGLELRHNFTIAPPEGTDAPWLTA